MEQSLKHISTKIHQLQNITEDLIEQFQLLQRQEFEVPHLGSPLGLRFDNTVLSVFGVDIPLDHRRSRDIIAIFFEEKTLRVPQQLLLNRLYPNHQNISHRLQDSLKTRLNKTMSRTRLWLQDHCCEPPLNTLHWLVFDPRQQDYILLRREDPNWVLH